MEEIAPLRPFTTPMHLVVAVTASKSAVLLRGQLRHAAQRGVRCTVISGPGAEIRQLAEAEGVGLVEVPMAREVSPVADVVTLFQLVRVLRRLRPDVVNAGTPKAGFLVLLAATIVRVPYRILTLRGLRSDTLSGWRFLMVSALEWVSSRLAHRVVCISPSLRDRAIELKVVPPAKARVIGSGSSNGVDVQRFTRSPSLNRRISDLRNRIGLPPSCTIVGFAGRFTDDKGVRDLLEIWPRIRAAHPTTYLILVGSSDGSPQLAREIESLREHDPRVRILGWSEEPEVAIGLFDVLVLPTRREGFGNVLLEAAALEIPAVATRVTGVVDAVADGVTGTLVTLGHADELAAAVSRYLHGDGLRQRHGAAGRARAVSEFSQEAIWDGQLELYRQAYRHGNTEHA